MQLRSVKFPDSYSPHTTLYKIPFSMFFCTLKANPRCKLCMTYALLNRVNNVHKRYGNYIKVLLSFSQQPTTVFLVNQL